MEAVVDHRRLTVGEGPLHELDEFPEHLHLDLAADAALADDLEGLERLALTSVGIDIGSSTSHLMFSRLVLRRRGADLSARFEVTERQVRYRSPILLTPYSSPTRIDVDRLAAFVAAQYGAAGLTPEQVDTGVVVITGEALNKENARPIAELFARQSGRFICASAGPHHEALLAAHGCGAVAASRLQQATVLNVDIGGGTTKLALVRRGTVVATAAISVGARLLAFDAAGRVTRIEAPARRLLRALGREGALGEVLPPGEREAVVRLLVDCLFEVLEGPPRSALARDLLVTEPLDGYPGLGGVDLVVFSGGVAEYLYGHATRDHGDLGLLLGRAIRHRLRHAGVRVLARGPGEGIRATVIGAGEYTVQASGVTSYLSDLAVLPVFGLKVVKAVVAPGRPVGAQLAAALAKFDLARFGPGLAIALALESPPSYPLLRAVAEDVAALVRGGEPPDAPLFLVVDVDIAHALGGILKEELRLPNAVIAVDGIDVGDLDYLDIGRPLGASESLPVTVKSLVFPGAARG